LPYPKIIKKIIAEIFVLQCMTMYICVMVDNKENKDTTITFRTSEELKKRLEEMASKEQRSLSNYIVYLLEKIVKGKK